MEDFENCPFWNKVCKRNCKYANNCKHRMNVVVSKLKKQKKEKNGKTDKS